MTVTELLESIRQKLAQIETKIERRFESEPKIEENKDISDFSLDTK